MHAIVLRQPGGPEQLKYVDVPTPEIKAGWSLLRVRGFGINRSEIFTRNGWSPSVRLPRILGIEAVGTIAASSDAQHLPVGQTAITLMGGLGREFDGGYAEYTLVPNNQLYPVTTKLSWSELAAIPETYFTAYGSLLALNLSSSDHLLIRGATSGVGTAARKLAHALQSDIEITGSTRNLDKATRLTDSGFNAVVQDDNGHLAVSGRPFSKILELVGTKTLLDSMEHLVTPGGIICVTGELGGEWTSKNFDPIMNIPSGSYLTAFSSDTVNRQAINDLLQLIEEHQIDVTPTRVFDLPHTGDAQAFLDSHGSFGKVVVLPFGTDD